MLTKVCGTAIFTLIAGVAFAQMPQTSETPKTHGAAMTKDAQWDDLDTNKDGYLTKDELKGSPAWITHFDKIDTNHDGKISPEEWKVRGNAGKS
jgi:hypothetical protein